MKEFVSILKQKLHLHKLCKQSFKIDNNFKFFGTICVVYNCLLKYVFLLMGFIHLDECTHVQTDKNVPPTIYFQLAYLYLIFLRKSFCSSA